MAFKRKEYHKEENCLNCGYPLVGRFCAHCGQKAFLHKDSFLHMMFHFVGDYFHYDSKFWRTIRVMVRNPGLVTLEYIRGKRVRYLNPIQLYIFITTLFFIVALSDGPEAHTKHGTPSLIQQTDTLPVDNSTLIGISSKKGVKRIGLGKFTAKESTLQAYDSVQKSLAPEQRDGFLLNHVRRKSYLHSNDIGEQLSHHFPKIFFILLPLFALILALLFRKSRLYYIDHLIFSIHFHSVIFAIFLFNIILINIWPHDTFETIVSWLVFTGIALYLYKSIRKVYPQPRWKTLIKLVFLFFAYLVCFLSAFLLLVSIIFLFF